MTDSTALNGGSGNSTTPQTTQNRCYQTDSRAAAPADDGGRNGFYLCPAQRLNRPTERHTTATGERQGRYVWMTCSCGENWWQVTR